MRNSLAVSFLSTLLLWSSLSSAEERKPYYIGAGLTGSTPENNSDFKNASGFQIYGGYKLKQKIKDVVSMAIEAGFHDSGDYDGSPKIVTGVIVRESSYNSAGVWAAGVFSYNILTDVDINGKLGMDFGDDSGGLLGAGVSYHFNPRITINADYVMRSESESGQLNITYQF